MFRLSLDPKLPEVTVSNYVARLHERLTQLFRETARVMQQVQAPPVARVSKTGATQAIGAASVTTVLMDASIDTHGFWEVSGAAAQYRPRGISGFYRVSAIVSFAAQAVTGPERNVGIYKDGVVYSQVRATQTTNEPLTLCITDIVYLDGAPDGTGNYVDIRVLSDEAVTLAGAAYNCTAAIDFIGGEQVA